MLRKISFESAAELLEAQEVSLRKEVVSLCDALDRVLAEDIYAAFAMPPFPKSPFDGFAFRAEDVPGTLEIRGESYAGCETLEALRAGTAMRINTGAPVPKGANCVIKQENTRIQDNTVRIESPCKPDTNIIHTGEEYEAGVKLLEKGTKLAPPHLGVLASQGRKEIPVFQKPRILLISTGTELAEPGQERRCYGIFNSSSASLGAYLQRMGFTVLPGGVVEDDPEKIVAKIREGLESDTDLVVTTGGASVGDYDFSVKAAEDLRMEILFWKVNAKPGGALMAARKSHKLLISLSGNPAAAMMSLLVVLQPYLRKLCGTEIVNTVCTLPILRDMPKTSNAVRLLRGHSVFQNGVEFFDENPGRGNGVISSFENCNLIGVIPAGHSPLRARDTIQVLRLPPDLC